MRTAASVITGAMALGAVAVPSTAFAATAKPVIAKVSSVSSVLGLRSATATFGVTVTATDASGIKAIYAVPYPVALAEEAHAVPTVADIKADGSADLLSARSGSATSQTAGRVQSMKVPTAQLGNNLAGAWAFAVLVVAKDGATTFDAAAGTFYWQRADALSAKVSATKVRKGAELNVTGRLSRVNWPAQSYQGYGQQWVRLEFRRSGSSTWTTAGWAKSSSTGALSAKVKDGAAGSWRFAFGGNADSGAVNSAQSWVGLA
ncbi:hypothetical protein [Streptacidiphilus albus]|uniref:hypothetical protein n=1 Tax=Streptacidiphilus albus TaxID=105425 RepID=UPI00128B2A06|nr:hypothetical protein [Streptacidiphilus albus]